VDVAELAAEMCRRVAVALFDQWQPEDVAVETRETRWARRMHEHRREELDVLPGRR